MEAINQWEKAVASTKDDHFTGTDLADFFQRYIADFNLYLSNLSIEELLSLANIFGIIIIILSIS